MNCLQLLSGGSVANLFSSVNTENLSKSIIQFIMNLMILTRKNAYNCDVALIF